MEVQFRKTWAGMTLVLGMALANGAWAESLAGLGAQTKFLYASQFASHSPQCPLANPLGGYWHVTPIPGASCTQQIGVQYGAIFSAQLDLPEGSAMQSIDIYYTRGANDDPLTFGLYYYTAQPGGSGPIGNSFTYGTVNTPATTYSSKMATVTLPNNAVFDSYDHVGNLIRFYAVQVAMPATNWSGFLGAAVHYNRQIAPAPATPSYVDIPATHPFFNEIEQLRKSGITLGCSSDSFCPDSPVTRGQMAAFLSRALGLQWDSTTNAH